MIATAPRAPVRILLPVWGRGYADQFFDLTLPSWLAPGNLPAVAARADAVLVFITGTDDRGRIERHPGLARLRAVMAVEFLVIDDLIVPRNHSTVLTLAWERAIKQIGAALPDARFLMLLSDMLLADGTLAAVLDALEGGARGVMIAGLQVVREAVADELRAEIALEAGVLTLEPRAAVRWGLARLHPSLAASFVDQPASHSVHPNHFFWRVDDQTAIARYFCMLLVGVRPETFDFEIAGPLDFAFQPEMCPSGPVEILDDSDRGFFVECAAREHESVLLAPGPADPARIAAGLARWTTAEQRALSATTIVFHGGDPPAADHPVRRAADGFVAALLARLPAQAQPHNDHPYWRQQATAFALERRLGGGDGAASVPTRHRLRDLGWLLIGRAPHLRPWHPFWHDDRFALAALARDGEDRKRLVVSDEPQPLARWLAARPGTVVRRSDALEAADAAGCTGVVLALGPASIPDIARLLDLVAPGLAPGALVLVHVIDRDLGAQRRIEALLVRHAGALARPGLRLEACRYVSSHGQRITHPLYALGVRLYTRGGGLRVAAAAAVLAATVALSALDNLARGWRRGVRGRCSAVTLVLRRS